MDNLNISFIAKRDLDFMESSQEMLLKLKFIVMGSLNSLIPKNKNVKLTFSILRSYYNNQESYNNVKLN